MIKIGASLISADPLNLKETIDSLIEANIDFFHIDIMDGHFVPNISLSPQLAISLSNYTQIPIDIHLMVTNPENVIKWFLPSKPKLISWHIEVDKNHKEIATFLKQNNISPGLAINPPTKVDSLIPLLDYIDFILIMSVNPGFGGQKFIENVLNKVEKIKKIKDIPFYIDGGINNITANLAKKAGINNLISGSFLVKSKDIKNTVKTFQTLF